MNCPWWEGLLVWILYLLILRLQVWMLKHTSLVTSLGYVLELVPTPVYTLVGATTPLRLQKPYLVTQFTSPAIELIYQACLMPET